MSKRLEQPGRYQHGNLMRFKAEKPGRLGRIQTRRSNMPAQKFSLLAALIHTTGTLITDETKSGVSNTPRKTQKPPFLVRLATPSFRFSVVRLISPQPCLPREIVVYFPVVKTMSFNEVKRQEARRRMATARRARRNPRAAAALQRRASLVGNGAKWRITNFKQVAQAMSKWA
jgi:hypothetical protein